tara:strand:+ start:156 stop:326 length:171 start_codon:yes stop_codon:yes gene_type:complete
MKVYCILGIDHTYGISLVSVPKIYGIYKSKDEALLEKNKLTFSGVEMLSISELELV